MDTTDVLWGLYIDNIEQGRHHETQRSNVASIMAAISAGLLAFVAQDRITSNDLAPSVFLTLLGIFGMIFSAKQYERFSAHMERARVYRTALEKELKDRGTPLAIVQLKEHADAKSKRERPVMNWVALNIIWLMFYVSVTILGAVLTWVALKSATP